MRVAFPCEVRCGFHIIIREVVHRDFRVDSLLHISEILVCQRISIIFRMTGHKNLPPAFASNQVHTCHIGYGQGDKVRVLVNVLSMNGGVSGMRGVEPVVKPTGQWVERVQHLVLEDTGQLFRQ